MHSTRQQSKQNQEEKTLHMMINSSSEQVLATTASAMESRLPHDRLENSIGTSPSRGAEPVPEIENLLTDDCQMVWGWHWLTRTQVNVAEQETQRRTLTSSNKTQCSDPVPPRPHDPHPRPAANRTDISIIPMKLGGGRRKGPDLEGLKFLSFEGLKG